MPANIYTASYRLRALKRRGMLPATAEALSDEDYLAFLNDELLTYLTPLLMSVREEFFVAEEDQTLTAGRAEYPIPALALGRKLRDVHLVVNGQVTPLPRIEPERRHLFVGQTGVPAGYYLKDDSVVVVPTPTAGPTLRLSYFRRPFRVVEEDQVRTVASVNYSDTISLTETPTPAFEIGDRVALVNSEPGFAPIVLSGRVSGLGAFTVTLTEDLPETLQGALAMGYFLVPVDTTPIPHIPPELFPLLDHRVVVRALEALGDKKVVQAEATCERMRRAALTLLTPRVEGSPRIIYNRNAPGFGSRLRRGV